MTYAELLELARAKDHGTAPGLIRQRFIQVGRDKTVAYDRFLSLASTHGITSPLVRKVMFFVWAYRDLRVRRFICERVADRNGKWRVNELVKIANLQFFVREKWLTLPAAQKARSNIQFFLEETGIFDEKARRIHLELDDGWLYEAAAVAAQHEEDPVIRRRLLDDVAQFLITNNWNGLINANASELTAIGANPVEDVIPLEDEAITIERAKQAPTREWNRRKPKQSDKKSTNVFVDLVARERANQSHFQLEQITANAIKAQGYVPRHNEHMDMYFETPHGSVLTEMKSCDSSNIHAQIRKGISQLFEYRYVYRETLGKDPLLVLIIETAPLADKAWLVEFLQSLKIVLAWKQPGTEILASTCRLPQALEGIVLPPSA